MAHSRPFQARHSCVHGINERARYDGFESPWRIATNLLHICIKYSARFGTKIQLKR
jgi:hypothetical protein